MSDCCVTNTSELKPPAKYRCPVNNKLYPSVGKKTVLHHVRQPWQKALDARAYYFCSDPDCDIVYFGQDDSVITKSELRTPVGIKEKHADRPVCYCFDITYATAMQNDMLFNYVKEKTQQSLCSCETSNPSGKCCLKDFPEQ